MSGFYPLDFLKTPLFIDPMLQVLRAEGIANQSFWIATIPSSTPRKQHMGFPAFIQLLAKGNLKIQNPSRNLLQRIGQKTPNHLGGDRSKSTQAKTLILHPSWGNLRGKPVVLMDDVVTTGNSLRAGIDILKDSGINIRIAIAMARTMRDGAGD